MSDSMAAPARITFDHWGYRHASRARFAVRGLSLDIPAGQRVLLLGASGIGKSTILEGVAGLIGASAAPASAAPAPTDGARDAANPTAGTDARETSEDENGGVTEGAILVDGTPADRAHGRVGLVLQDPEAQAVFARFGDNVAFGPENLGVPREEIWPRVRASLHAVGLGDIQLHRSVMHLSGGQMQRLALAGALAMRPGALLLDEPTANLDPEGVEQVVDAVRDVLERHGSTMILVEHRAAPWMDLIDRVIVLARGEDEGACGEDEDARATAGTGTDTTPGPAMRSFDAGNADVDVAAAGNMAGPDPAIKGAAAPDGAGLPTRIIADGTPDEVFSDPTIDFDALGVWVPPRYPAAARQRMPRVGAAAAPAPATPSSATPAPAEPILVTRGLAIGRNGHAIAGPIDLGFRAGEITALVGPNGAGKSTFSLTLAGLLEPVAGHVEASAALARGVRGGSREPHRWSSPELASRIGYVFQNPEHQFAKGTVLDEVMVAPLRAGLGEEESRRRAQRLLDRFGLARYAQANPYTLSGGEKRRLTVASALACAPGVLLLDEPTFGQDRATWASMIELIAGLRADGVCVIIVTHDEELVAALDARVIRFGEGGWRGERDADGGADDDAAASSAGDAAPESLDDVHADTAHAGAAHVDTARTRLPVEDALSRMNAAPDEAGTRTQPRPQSRPQGRPRIERDQARPRTERIAVTPAASRTEEPKQASRSPLLATINPGFRFLGAFLVGLPMLISLDPVSSGIMVAALFVIFGAIGITPWRLVRSSWPVWIGAPGSAVAIILYGRVGGELYWRWGLIQVSELSVRLGVSTMLRVIAIGVPAVILLLGIDPTDLADSFSECLHLPERFVYGGLAGMRLFAVLQDDWAALSASRRSRGLGDGSRLKAVLPQAFALLVLSIRRSSTLATAMEARGFGGDLPRSHARESVVRARDWVFLAICVALPVAALLVAVATGDFALFGDRVSSVK